MPNRAARGRAVDIQTLLALVTVGGTISGIVLGWIGRSRAERQEIMTEAGSDAAIRADVEYIKRGIDDLRFEQRAQGQRFDALAERVTRSEESLKALHRRVDRLDGGRSTVQ